MEFCHKIVCSSSHRDQDGRMHPIRKNVLFYSNDIVRCRYLLAEFYKIRSTDSSYSDCSQLENGSFSVSRDNIRYTYSVE